MFLRWRGTFAAVALIWLIVWPQLGWCDDHEDIFHWVADQMQIKNAYALPVIKMVGRTELGTLFTSGSKKTITRWVADHGQSGAENLMNLYTNSAVGLFDPKTCIVYVGNFLSPCRQKAILAHEITHYIQYVTSGPITGGGMVSEMILMEREMEASAIEQRFEEKFCADIELALYWESALTGEMIYFP